MGIERRQAFLIVGLNGDESVYTLKGPGRPVIPQQERAEILANLECVDAVVIFEELTPQKTVAALLPDILVKGGDYRPDQIAGAEHVLARGGEVRVLDFRPGCSTTGLINKVQETVI